MIYIACPEKMATGGTELLHQFYYKLRKVTNDVRIFYFNYSSGIPVSERFEKYEVQYVTNIEDSSTNVLIIPEVSTYLVREYKNIKKFIWWLSVDNYYASLEISSNPLKKFIKKLYNPKKIDFKDDDMNHLVQSHYALAFLKRKGVKHVDYLSDYLNEDFFKSDVKYIAKHRENRVLYNPKKGYDFTKKLIGEAKDMEFIPLINYTPIEIMELCKYSKVYIDFGNHPGKDRFPREAAQMGCIIITGLQGSAKYSQDVPIPSNYKFNNDFTNQKAIIQKIRESIDNYDQLIQDFKEYRESIKGEEKQFESDIQKLWQKYFRKYVSL